MNIFKHKNTIKNQKIIICLCGYLMDKKPFEFIEKECSGYDFIYPNLYDLYEKKDDDQYYWKKKIVEYLQSVTERYESVAIIGYAFGGLIAAVCADLPFINKIVLISPSNDFITKNNHKNLSMLHTENCHLLEYEIDINDFILIHSLFINIYKTSLIKSSADILIIHAANEINLKYLEIHNLYKRIENPNKQLICIGSTSTELLKETHSVEIIRAIVPLFLNKNNKNR